MQKLSPAEEDILRTVFNEFGRQSRWTIVDYMHSLPEWKNPAGSSTPIAISDILQALNESREDIQAIVSEIEQERKIAERMESLR